MYMIAPNKIRFSVYIATIFLYKIEFIKMQYVLKIINLNYESNYGQTEKIHY